MINTFSITRLPNPIYVQFMDYIVSTVEAKDPEALQIKPQFDVLCQKVSELKELYKSVQGSTISEKILEADSLRDQILTGLIKIVDGNTYHYFENRRTAAHKLQKNIQNYGPNLVRNDYQTETVKIEKIATDWRTKTELIGAMNELHLNHWVIELETANNEFKRQYALRTDELSKISDENMQGKRIEVNAAYEDLCNHLNSHSVINKSSNYDAVISTINVYVEQYSTLLKQKKSHAEKTDSKEN